MPSPCIPGSQLIAMFAGFAWIVEFFLCLPFSPAPRRHAASSLEQALLSSRADFSRMEALARTTLCQRSQPGHDVQHWAREPNAERLHAIEGSPPQCPPRTFV